MTSPRSILRGLLRQHGTQRALAEWLGITPTYVSYLLRGERPVSKRIARKIGYTRRTVYTPTEER